MSLIAEVQQGIAAEIAPADGGWVAAAVCSPNTDDEWLSEVGRYTVTARPGQSTDDWSTAFATARMCLRWIESRHDRTEQKQVAEAPMIVGPALVSGAAPAVTWVESDGATWRLCLGQRDEARVLLASPRPLRHPAAARDADGRIWVACDARRQGRDATHLLPADNPGCGCCVPGRRATVACTGTTLWVASELCQRDRTDIVLSRIRPGAPATSQALSSAEPWGFLPHLHADPAGLHLVWESTPGFAPDDRQGYFRQVQVRRIQDAGDRFAAVRCTPQGIAPIRAEAFEDRSVFNRVPVHPRLFGDGVSVWVAYRSYRFVARYGFGWDLFAVPLHGGCEPQAGPLGEVRSLVGRPGFPDTRYGVACAAAQGVLVAAHSMDHTPPRADGPQEQRVPQRGAREHRIEIHAWDTADLPAPEPQVYVPLAPRPPERLEGRAPDPPALPAAPPARHLVWGDLHAHTLYSKCMACNDGTPADVLRFQRDVLGCQVLCLTDHVEYVSDVEFRYLMDTLAAEAADDLVILYGVEWAKLPAHDTNFYAHERGVFDRLRAILLQESHLRGVFARIRDELPDGSVAAIRHFHGRRGEPHGIDGSQVVDTFCPAVEWAMEALQTRGDVAADPLDSCPAFPVDFLWHGADVGVAGGSDHSRGGPLKFALTGFWVDKLTPADVFASLRQRRTIACAAGKLALWAIREPGAVRVHAASHTPLVSAALWCDGVWDQPVTASGHAATVRLPSARMAEASGALLVRVEACPDRAGWPPVIGYCRPLADQCSGPPPHGEPNSTMPANDGSSVPPC